MIAGAIAVAVIGLFAAFKVRGARQQQQLAIAAQKALESRSVAVAAEVESFERTGLSVNDIPQVRVRVTCRLADGRQMEASDVRLLDPLHASHVQKGAPALFCYDPDDVENFEIFLGYESEAIERLSAAAGPEPIEATAATLDAPLWTYGTDDAEREIYAPRRTEHVALMLVDIDDPHSSGRGEAADAVIDSAALILQEALWARTDVNAAVAVFVDVTNRKLIEPTGALRDYADVAPAVESCDPRPVAVWGAALERFETEGIELSLRKPGDERIHRLAGPVDELVDMLVDWCQRHGVGEPVEPPAWFKLPPELEALGAYGTCLDHLLLQVLADSKNGVLEPLTFHPEIVATALDALGQHRSDRAAFARVAVASGNYAARAGKLPLERRLDVEALLDDAELSAMLAPVTPAVRRAITGL